MHNIQPVHPPSDNIVASPNIAVDTGIYSTTHTSILSCFLPHIHLSLYPLNHPSPPLPSPSLPSCCDTFTLGTSVLRHVQVRGRGCVQNSKHSNCYSLLSIPTVHVQLMYATTVAEAVISLHSHEHGCCMSVRVPIKYDVERTCFNVAHSHTRAVGTT